jgi:signal peptidase II
MVWQKLRITLPLMLLVLLVDCSTKDLAVTALSPEYTPHPVAGDILRLTLAYNQDAAMGLPLGRFGRWPLIATGVGIIAALVRMLWLTSPGAGTKRVALGLVIGGALGNLSSRITTPRGVVDFIDLGIGDRRFYLFNVADIAVCAGAVLLAWILWQEGRNVESPA